MRQRGMSPEKAEQVRIKRCGNSGTKLRRMRVKKGFSQFDLSLAADVSKKTVLRYEQGNHKIDGAKFPVICALCNALGCKIADIIEDEAMIELFNEVK